MTSNFRRTLLSIVLLLPILSIVCHACDVDCACTACLGDGEGCVCDTNSFAINEVHLDSHGDVTWVEIVNIGKTRSMIGVTLRLDDREIFRVKEGEVRAGQALVVYNRHNAGEGACSAASPTLAASTGSVFVAASWSQMSFSAGRTLSLADSDGTVLAEYVVLESSMQGLDPEVFGSPVPSFTCSPGVRSDGVPFVRLSINEIMIDAGLHDYNLDNVTGELSSLPAHGMADAYVEIVNQECYNVDIGGFQICVTCPSVCEPVYDGSNNLLGCPPLQAPSCTPFHLFPPNTVIPPGGAVLVFAGYSGIRGGDGAGITFSMEESADFGYSVVQIASLPSAVMETFSVQLGHGRRMEVTVDAETLGIQKLLPILPCLVCASDDPTCKPDSEQPLLLVGSNPLISYSVMNGAVTHVTAEVGVLDIKSGISFAHIPEQEESLFMYHCVTSDTCGCDPSCSSPGYTIDGSYFVQPKVVGYKTISDAAGSCLSPGDYVTVTTVLSNVGDQTAFGVTFLDVPFDHSELVAGSVTATGSNCSVPIVTSGNTFGDSTVMIEIPQLCICSFNDVIVTYQVRVTPTFDCSSELVTTTQGSITWAYGPAPTSSVTTSSPTFSPADSPNIVTFCGLASLEILSDSFFTSTGILGQNSAGTVSVVNNGHFPACGVSLSIASDSLTCYPADENPVTVDASSVTTLEFYCAVPQPFPCLPAPAAVDVAVLASNNDGSMSATTGYLNVLVFDNVTSVLTVTCSELVDGCCPPDATLSFSGYIQNSGTRNACDVAFQLDGVSDYGQIVLGSVTADYCEISIGNNFGDENGPVFFVCPQIESGGMEYLSFDILLSSPAPTESPSLLKTNAAVSFTSDGSDYTYSVTTSDVGVLRQPTEICLTAYPDLSLSKMCSSLPPQHKWEAVTYVQYTLILENTGTQETDVTVTDPLSPYHVFVSSSTPQCSYDAESHSVICTFYSVAPSAPISIVYSANLNPESPLGDIQETSATAVGSFGASETITARSETPYCNVTQQSVVTLTSFFDVATVTASQDVTVTLTVTNSIVDGSNEAIEGFTLSDSPTGCSITGDVTLSPPNGWLLISKDASGLVINGPSLIGGQSASVTYTCRSQSAYAWDDKYVMSNAVVTTGEIMATATASAKIVANTDLVLTMTSDASVANAGDYVLFSVRIVNFGTRDAHGVLLHDVLSPSEPLDAPPFYICSDNSYAISISSNGVTSYSCDYTSLLGPGLPITDLPALGGCADVTYYLQVACPIDSDVYSANNSAYASYLDIDAAIADWCQERRSTSEDITVEIGIGGEAIVMVTKSTDVSSVPPGENVTYTVQITNAGNRNIFHGVFTDTIVDPYLNLVLGSVISDGVVTAGNNYGDAPNFVSVDLGVIEGTACGGLILPRYVTFVANVPASAPTDLGSVCNQGSLSYTLHAANASDNLHIDQKVTSSGNMVAPTDDPNTLPIDDATCIPIDHNPQFILTVSSIPDNLTAGDVVTFTVLIQNDGTVVGSNLIYNAYLDPNLLLIQGSVTVPKGVQNLQNVIISGNRVEDTHVTVSIGTLGLADSFVLSFKAKVADPYVPQQEILSPPGLHVERQSSSVGFFVTLTNIVGTSSKNYTTLVVTEALVDIAPSIFVTKSADLASAQGLVPGQKIQYTISVSNLGNAVGNVKITDSPSMTSSCLSSPMTFLAGTVDTNRGTVVTGNRIGEDSYIEVDVGTLAPFETATILFEAAVSDPFPCLDLLVTNQASYFESYTSTSGVSDDPTTPPIGDATETPIYASPFISAFKSVAVKGVPSVLGESPVANPGDTLVYSVSIQNDGNQAAFAINVTDTLDSSLTLSLPMYFNGNALSSESVLDLDTGSFATEQTRTFLAMVGGVTGGNTSVLKFDAVVSSDLTSATISNQAVVTGANFDEISSSSPSGSALDLPTSIGVNAIPNLDVTLTWSSELFEVVPGSTLWYTISVVNSASSNAAATKVMISDSIDTSLSQLNLGSVTTSMGVVVEGNTNGDRKVLVSVPTISAGQTVTVQYSVTLVSVFPASVNSISNIATVSGSNFATILSRDPSIKTIDGATVTPVTASADIQISFSATSKSLPVSSSNLIQVGGQYVTMVDIRNVGNQMASNVVITADIDPYSSFVAGSVVTTAGVVTAGNYLGNVGPVVVTVPFLGGLQSSVTFSYSSSVKSPFAGSSAEVTPYVKVTGDNFNPAQQSASFPVNAATQISVRSTCDFCVSTGDRCNSLNPGDKIQVSAVVTNSGNQNAFGVMFLTNPASPMIAVGQPFNVVPSSASDTLTFEAYSNGSLQVNSPLIAGGASLSFSYYLEMTNAAAGSGISQDIFVWNNDGASSYESVFSCAAASSRQGVTSRRSVISARSGLVVPIARRGDECPPVFTPCQSGGFQPNKVNACGLSSATLKDDNDRNGVVTTGDILQFNVTIFVQSSCSDLPSVTFTNAPDPINVQLVSGTVRPTFGRVVSGNNENDGIVLINMGKVPGNRQSSSTILFDVTVTGRTLSGSEQLTNSGYLTVEYYGNYEISPLNPDVFFSTPSSAASGIFVSMFAVFVALAVLMW